MNYPSYRTIALVVGLFVVAILIFAVPSCLQKQRSERAQARVDQSQADAASESAKDAIGTVARSGEEQAASEDLTRQNEQAIRAAEGANVKVSPAIQNVGIVSLCRRAAYANELRCAPYRKDVR